jgi:hypothetical protein
MKAKVFLGVLFVAGLAGSLAIASPHRGSATPTTTTSTTTTGKKPKCEQVELKGDAISGSLTFTVKKANKRGRNLVGHLVTIPVAAGAKVKAKACTTAGSATLTLRDLHVEQKKPK